MYNRCISSTLQTEVAMDGILGTSSTDILGSSRLNPLIFGVRAEHLAPSSPVKNIGEYPPSPLGLIYIYDSQIYIGISRFLLGFWDSN